MKKYLVLATLALAASCVTINVYFPEAAAERAADMFIEDVIGSTEGDDQVQLTVNRTPFVVALVNFIIPPAHAQDVDLNINTPAIKAIQGRMKARFDGAMKPFFDSGSIGFTNDGMVAVRDLASVALPQRSKVNKLVSEDNRDREAVYKEIAVANGHPEWEPKVRSAFAERWIANARSGWYYQSADGTWRQK